MNRKLTNALIFILTILVAELAIEYVHYFLKIKTGFSNKYLLTLTGMAMIVAVFYPVFAFVNYLTEHFTQQFVKKTKKMTSNAFTGLLITFLLGFGILFLIYLKKWYGVTLW